MQILKKLHERLRKPPKSANKLKILDHEFLFKL